MKNDSGRGRAAHLLGAAMLASLTLAACGGGDAAGTDTAAATQTVVLGAQDVAVARMSPIASGVTLTGSLQPAQSVTLTAQVAGTVTRVRVDRGTPVSRGQTLATIAAEGVRSQAAGARANVAAAQAQLALARRQLEAARVLHEAGATSAIEYETARASYEAVEAQLAAARAQATGAAEAASHTTVTSPIGGAVSQRFVEAGEPVSVGGQLFTIVDPSTLELAGRISVDEASRVRVGQPVTFTLSSGEEREFRGTVARVEPVADPATRQVGVYLRFANPGNRVIAGQFATGRVAGQAEADAVVIPIPAARSSGAGSYVLLLDGGRVVRREVALGARDEQAGVVEVLSGLEEGDRVIATPVANITEGTAVTVASDEGQRAPSSAPAATPAPDSAPATATPAPGGGATPPQSDR